jgi:hypothetical protein
MYNRQTMLNWKSLNKSLRGIPWLLVFLVVFIARPPLTLADVLSYVSMNSSVVADDPIVGNSSKAASSPPFASPPQSLHGISIGNPGSTFIVNTHQGGKVISFVAEAANAFGFIDPGGHIHGQVFAQAESDGPANRLAGSDMVNFLSNDYGYDKMDT